MSRYACSRLASAVVLCGCGLLLTSCDEEVIQAPDEPEAPAAAASTSSRKSRKGAEVEEQPQGPAPPQLEFQEEDFVENERNRDPFRAYTELFAKTVVDRNRPKVKVILEDYSIDDLKLIALITRIRPAKAMLEDPKGVGHVVHRNDLVGKAERVQVGLAGAEYEINWRVDRIRDSDVVLVREDPSNPDVPSATRVIALRPEETLP